MMVQKGKMKRAFFCCLRGGNCNIDVETRKKCNYCRYKKCKVNGMVPEFKEAKSKSDSADDQPKSSSNSMDLVPGVPPQISFELGSDQLSGLTILVDLWQMQKIVHPVGLSNILPILESMKRREQFPTDVIKTHDKLHERWMAQFCFSLDEFGLLNSTEQALVLRNTSLAHRLVQGLYLSPGAGKSLLSIIKGMTSDKAELQVVESFLTEHKIEAREQFWGSFAHRIDPANQEMHEDLNTKILAWGRQGMDDISEILVCLMLLFSQDEQLGSKKIKSVAERWRFLLWQYLRSRSLPQDAKERLFSGAEQMVVLVRSCAKNNI